MDKVRIDKWLWAVRIYKTRSIASTACSGGKVKIEGNSVKPSRMIQINEIVSVRKRYITFRYQVLGLLEKRVSAKMLNEFVLDITPEEEKLKMKINLSIPSRQREKGSGRPTKKERRNLDNIRSKLGY